MNQLRQIHKKRNSESVGTGSDEWCHEPVQTNWQALFFASRGEQSDDSGVINGVTGAPNPHQIHKLRNMSYFRLIGRRRCGDPKILSQGA